MRGRRFGAACLVVGLACACASGEAWAQSGTEPRFAAFVGPQWVGTADLGGRDAVETGNRATPLTLFRTDSTLDGGLGVAGGLSARLAAGLWAEAGVAYHSATLTTHVTGDAEGAGDVDVVEGLQQYRIEAGALWMPAALRVGGRTQLFAVGGAGYLRQLHGSGLLAETGHTMYGGGGLMIWLPRRRGGTFRASGLRLEGRLVVLDGGASVAEGGSTAPAASALFFLGF